MENTPITTLITGASSGFGAAMARRLHLRGHRLLLNARRADRMETLIRDLDPRGDRGHRALVFDVRDRAAVEASAAQIRSEIPELDVLINNAGLALGLGGIDQGNPDHWDAMVDTNVKGLLYVTRAFLPMMNPGAHILNIGSVAGKQVYPNGNVYCASKHAVDALSRAMRLDLLERGIKVSNIAPGMAETEFSLVRFEGDAAKAASVYQGLKPLTAEDIAETADWILSRPAHVCINDVLIMPSAQADAIRTLRR
ncbi:SDR family NAD(P)-dependent oxidoreductase [bacterium]|nr:SDR family NAD(P)-dependent oxidoreductase [bacterium]